MANIKSQIKRNRQNEKRRLRNKSVRAEVRTRSKTAVTAAEVGAEDSAELLRLAVKRIDKAASQGVIHKNTAANHKSRLVRRIAAVEAAAPSSEVARRIGTAPIRASAEFSAGGQTGSPGRRPSPGPHGWLERPSRRKVNIFSGSMRAPSASRFSIHSFADGPCLGTYSSIMA